jgi:hypothetical protein
VVLCGCETWSVTLGEYDRLCVIKNRVLRGIFGPKRDVVTTGWRKYYNEDLCFSPNVIRMIKLRIKIRAGYVARVEVR